MKLDFYYFSYQCPLNKEMLQMLNAYSDQIEIQTFDITGNNDLAEKLDIFFPTLIVLNDQYRYYAPLKRVFLEEVCKGIIPKENPYLPELGNIYVEHVIEPLTRENVCIACECCGMKSEQVVNAKKEFLENVPGEVYEYLHKTRENQLIGGVEYLPSIAVPYPVPHEEKTAYLTCLYCSDPNFDYKSAPLRELENYLKNEYDRIIVVTDEEGVFPNGNMEFFLKHGYTDEGIIFKDPQYCKLHLMSKLLRKIIGSGNTAHVYEWEDGKVLKLFSQEYPDEAIEKEYHNAMVIADLDFAKPRAYEIISRGNRKGILYDRVEGESLLDWVMQTGDVQKCAWYMSTLHKEVVKHRVSDVPNYKDFLKSNIAKASLTVAKRNEVLLMIDKLADGDTLCHGDFHPGNILLSGDGAFIIDFMNVCCGNYLYDVARTVYLVEYTPVPLDVADRDMVLQLKEVLSDAYLMQMNVTKEMIQDYLYVISVARTGECPNE